MNIPDLMTVADVSKRLQVSERTVRRWIAGGLLPSVKAGRLDRIEAAALEQFLLRGRPAGRPGRLPGWLSKQYQAAKRERAARAADPEPGGADLAGQLRKLAVIVHALVAGVRQSECAGELGHLADEVEAAMKMVSGEVRAR